MEDAWSRSDLRILFLSNGMNLFVILYSDDCRKEPISDLDAVIEDV